MLQMGQVRFMKKDSFVLYTEYMEQIELLSMEQRGVLLTAIFAYVSDMALPDMDGITKMAFAFIKSRIDKDTEKYAKTIEKRKEAGKLGGRPKANGSSEKQEKAKKANGFSEKQNNPVYDNDNVNVNDHVLKDKTYTCAFEALWKAYPRKKEKAGAYKCYKARLADGFSEDELETAVKRYADECRRQKTEQKYIKLAATFLGPSTPFTDYLGEAEENDTGRKTATGEKGYVQQLIEQGYTGEFEGF